MTSWDQDQREASSALAFLRCAVMSRPLLTPTPTPTPTSSDCGSSRGGDTDDGSSDLELSSGSSSYVSDVGSDDVDLDAMPPVTDIALRTTRAAYGSNSSPAEDGVDCISSLPDNLLVDILSRLSLKEAGRTGVLSSRWRAVWPEIKLDCVADAELLPPCGFGGPSFLSTVVRCLQTLRGNIAAARITSIGFGGRVQELRDLILLLKEKKVRDLVLIHNPLPFALELPKEILSCSEVLKLHLGFFQFPYVSKLSLVPHLQNLRVLCLLHCVISDADLEGLIEHTPHLDVLGFVLNREHPTREYIACRKFSIGRTLRVAVAWMCHFNEVVVADTPRLEKLLLHNSLSIGDHKTAIHLISSPMLKVIGFLDLSKHQVVIGGNMVEIGMEWRPDIRIPSVTILGVKIDMAVDREVKLLALLLRCFPNVQTLHVMLVSSCTIRSTITELWESEDFIDCIKFKLETVVLHGFGGDTYEFQLVSYLAKEALSLRAVAAVCDRKVLERQLKIASSGRVSARILVIPRSAALSFDSLVDTCIWAQPPFLTLDVTDGEGRRGLELLPTIIADAGRKPEVDENAGSCQSTGIAFHCASHTWCFQSATDLSVEDPFFKLMSPIA